MNFSAKKIIDGIKKCAKDLSDDEVLSLYKTVKEKLDAQNKDEDQVLDGEKSGEEPMQSENNSLVPPIDEAPTSPDKEQDNTEQTTEQAPESSVEEKPAPESAQSKEDIDESIDDLLSSLGLGDEVVPESSDPEQAQEKEASGEEEDVIGSVLKEMDLETQPEETDVTDVAENANGEQDDEFSPENFKTAGRGFQVNRKDKDLMADDAIGPKYDEPEKNPPRTDCRRPNGIRWNRGEENQDKDVAGDKDLK